MFKITTTLEKLLKIVLKVSSLIETEKDNFSKDRAKHVPLINNVKGNIVTRLLEFRFALIALNNISDSRVAF